MNSIVAAGLGAVGSGLLLSVVENEKPCSSCDSTDTCGLGNVQMCRSCGDVTDTAADRSFLGSVAGIIIIPVLFIRTALRLGWELAAPIHQRIPRSKLSDLTGPLLGATLAHLILNIPLTTVTAYFVLASYWNLHGRHTQTWQNVKKQVLDAVFT